MVVARGAEPGGAARLPAGRSANPMGQLSGRDTFGHNGSNTCLAWADPARRVVMVYLTNLVLPGDQGARHQGEVSDAILSA